jgi:flagellar hook protein FlgE
MGTLFLCGTRRNKRGGLSVVSSVQGGNAFYSSASGLRAAQLGLDIAANNVANGQTDGFMSQRVDSQAAAQGGVSGMVVMVNMGMVLTTDQPSQTDYSEEGLATILAQNAFKANAVAFRSNREVEQTILDVLG